MAVQPNNHCLAFVESRLICVVISHLSFSAPGGSLVGTVCINITMIPIKCARCGYLQHIGDRAVRDVCCDRCGNPIYSHSVLSPTVIAIIAVVVLIGAIVQGYPLFVDVILAIPTIFFVVGALSVMGGRK